jgi:hypothetical protein
MGVVVGGRRPAGKGIAVATDRRALASQGETLLAKSVQQLVERAGELRDTLSFERLGDVVVIDSRSGRMTDEAAGLSEVVFQAWFRVAVFVVLGEGLFRHRVDGVRSDQLLDIESVKVVGVFGGS